MVSGTDTGNIYALQAERYYDVPDEEGHMCGECWHWDSCPCGCGWGMCDVKGEWFASDSWDADDCPTYTYCEERFRS